MRRRDFLSTALTGAAALSPLAAAAQQPARMRRLGILAGAPNAKVAAQLGQIPAFLDELRRLGWTDGRNIAIDIRYADSKPDLFKSYAVELVAEKPDVILGVLSWAVKALLAATRTIPIVFTLSRAPMDLWRALPTPAATSPGSFPLSRRWPASLSRY